MLQDQDQDHRILVSRSHENKTVVSMTTRLHETQQS